MCRKVVDSCILRGPPCAKDARFRAARELPGTLENLPALAAGQNSKLFPVLGNGATSDLDVLIAEQLHDLLIRVWVPRILTRDDLLDLQLHGLGRQIVAVGAGDARV